MNSRDTTAHWHR